ncbi:uncharacterized protein LOC100277349 [Zea mays]|uniref:Uncharacterized protein n=1 Tax=Zea mays TaxID=4577 RepID=B6TTB0_MAIZE|nr:uncharacterized protein LOC100277349 [Zea mays]ACG40343.1 hypothetical protein [Zea mays]ONM29252.1 hypothetical protein ZEAMMB73_Zm00001d039565 [Zea mays]|eukprot:NP_001144412.1 uncharacterized protein LOC100277349 [Zea mays]
MARAEQESLAAPPLESTATARQRVPSVEVHLYRRGAGPVAIFRSDLAGPRRDRLDVRRIQASHGLRALFAFRPEGSRRGRGLRIRCDPAAGYSALPFRDGAAIALDGEPGESWTKPVSVIVAGLLVLAVMAAVAANGVPEPLRSSRLANGIFAPWILFSAVIIFARARTRPRAP